MDNVENKAVEEHLPEVASEALESDQERQDLICPSNTGRNLIDILLPANPPAPINARLIRRLRD